MWYGWLMPSELDTSQTGETLDWKVRRHYTWGLDLGGQSAVGPVSDRSALESAGGIGGLLATHGPNDPLDPNDAFGDFLNFYDGNGNVGRVANQQRETEREGFEPPYPCG